MRHRSNLDILRSFAVATVAGQHLVFTLNAHTSFRNPPLQAFMSQIGRVGVLAFFVHTSLVLMYSLDRMARVENHVSLRFYVRRFFRIYPLAIFCIVIAVIFHIPDNTWEIANIITPKVILVNLLLIQNIVTKTSVLSPLWSLPYEVEMYVALPALYFLTLNKRGVTYLCGLIVLFSCLGVLASWRFGGHLNLAAYIPCFLCGVLCFALRHRIHPFLPSVLWPPFVLLLISGYCFVHLHSAPKYWVGWIFCIILGLSINAFHDSTNKPINFAAEKIALYSYGVYLIHIPVLYLVFMVLGIHNLMLGLPLFALLTSVFSVLAYHMIESPLINLGKRLSHSP